IEALSGLGMTVTIFLVLLFLGTALDRFVFLSDSTRLLITFAGYAVSAVLAGIAILWPLVRIRSDRKIAAQIETACPELEEGLLTSIELADAEAGGKFTGGSRQMIEQAA